MNAILERVYPSRIEAIEILRQANGERDIEALKASAQRLRDATELFGRAPAGKLWRIFAESIECIRLIEDWRRAVLIAETDADRFLRAARARLKQIRSMAGKTVFEEAVLSGLQPIEAEFEIDQVTNVRRQLASISMPVAIYAESDPSIPTWARERDNNKEETEDIAVAFLEFSINGRAAERIQQLQPHMTNDLEIAIRVSRWPKGAKTIKLSPISIEPASTFDLPVFEFERPLGAPPFLFRQRGRMVLHAPQSFHARPYEFIYAAEFSPIESEQPVIVAGQRTLRLDGVDVSRTPITGYPRIDSKIIELRERMRLEPRISETEISDALILLASLGNLMGQAVQDSRYPKPIQESDFQADVQEFLRRYPQIGVELEVQAHSTGGRTDLSFRGIRIELKSERERRLSPKDCERYAKQAASYGVGTNRNLAFLCVLDSSVKAEPPFPIEDGLAIIPVETATAPVYIVTCLVQGGLPKPSSLSR